MVSFVKDKVYERKHQNGYNDLGDSLYAHAIMLHVWNYLASRKQLLLDIHLHDHAETLCNDIRHKALIQYTHPFVSVDLKTMVCALKANVLGPEKELEALITKSKIQACIDSHDKILYARKLKCKPEECNPEGPLN